MKDAEKKIAALLEVGKSFTYQNFANLSQNGYPESYKPDWIAWRTRVTSAISSLFGPNSAPYRMIEQGAVVMVLGNGPDKFKTAQSYYLGALEAALQVLVDDTFGELADHNTKAPGNFSNRVFVVHGHDEVAKQELEILLTEMGLEPVVLHRQPDGGRTIIEKFEHYADVGFAFVLLTPDEVAYLASQEGAPDDKRDKEKRARPNVIFEFGYFVGRLGRGRTCCLYKGGVTPPSDLSGLVYKEFRNSVEEVGYGIIKELQAAGYKLKVGSSHT